MKTRKLKTPITYYGGKQTMLKHIRPLIPSHNLYTEAFAGAIKNFADSNGWKIIEVERQISACKASSRRIQSEWIVINYDLENIKAESALKLAA